MSQTKVIDFKLAKRTPQFEVLEAIDDKIINCVRRLKDGAFFFLNHNYSETDENSLVTHIIKITHFDDDLINVCYTLTTGFGQRKERGGLTIEELVGPINEIALGFYSMTFIYEPKNKKRIEWHKQK